MDEGDAAAARTVGLDRLATLFPYELHAAIAAAAEERAALDAIDDPRAEPWPPMKSAR